MGEKHWYVIHTYSGYENKVKNNLTRKVESLDMKDRIFRAEIPTENVVEDRNGKRVIVEKKLYPGYVLVEMIVDPETWYAVRNTPGVTGFVGSEKIPVPLTDAEAERFLRSMGIDEGERRKNLKIKFKPGDCVKINEGGFKGFVAQVLEVNENKATVTVMINMFGRETKAEVDCLQIEEVE